MEKRGQVTAFIVLGIIILAVIGVAIYISQVTISSKKPTLPETVSYEVQSVEEFVTSCLEEALDSAVSFCSGSFKTGEPKCPDYEAAIEEKLLEDFCLCIPACKDFSTFKNLDVEAKGDPEPKAKLVGGGESLILTMVFPIQVNKGESEYLFGTTDTPFVVEHSFVESGCVPIKLRNNDYSECLADEDKSVELLGLRLEYREGDKVGVGDKCIAC